MFDLWVRIKFGLKTREVLDSESLMILMSIYLHSIPAYSLRQKKLSPLRFLNFFPNG